MQGVHIVKKYKLSILLATAVLGGTYVLPEANKVLAAEVKTEVVAPSIPNENTEIPKEVKNIGEIQGESHLSPLVGNKVIINNVIVLKRLKLVFMYKINYQITIQEHHMQSKLHRKIMLK